MPADPLSPPAPRICFDRVLPDEYQRRAAEYAIKLNRANLPFGVDVRSASPKELAIEVGKKWGLPADGSPRVLRCRFLDGRPDVQRKVADQARQLEQFAHIRFDFITAGTADIRIGFNTRDGSWSYVGTDCAFVPQRERTMNFGWLYPNTPTSEYSSVVKHEFLHALGALHEHQSPGATIAWNEPLVLKVYGGPPNNWDRATVQANVLDKYGPEGVAYTEFDPRSIMLYPVDPQLTLDGFGSDWNTELSALDRTFLLTHYPKPAGPVPEPPVPEPPVPEPPVPEPPVPPEPGPPPEAKVLVVGGAPTFGEVLAGTPEVYRLTLDRKSSYFIGAHRVTGVGGLFVEAHKGGYPSTQKLRRPGAITGTMLPGDFYITVAPVDPSRGRGRFRLACRRTGK